MHIKRTCFFSPLLFAFSLLWAVPVLPEDAPGCLDCHDDGAAHAIFDTVHREIGGGGAAACTTCHGASEKHDRRGRKAEPDISFGPKWLSPAGDREAACLSCHESGDQLMWAGSAHQQENMGCDSCHNTHQPEDLSLHGGEAGAQCINCHTGVRAELNLPSRHPIKEGKTACGDCHNPHGGLGDGALHEATLNDNCLSCHEEYRGPFLWEHAPVAEDCSECHRPHGSVHARLLNTRGPALCQQCHAAAFHPSVPYGGEGVSGANANLLGKNCLNCHNKVHGSNHPSGARLTR
jgi:DmsE family decaheme c-type cytochrome